MKSVDLSGPEAVNLNWMHWFGGWPAACAVIAFTVAAHWVAFPPGPMPEAAWLFVVPLFLWLSANPPAKLFWTVAGITGWLSWFGLLIWLRNFTDHLSMPGKYLLGLALTAALALIVALFWIAWCWLAWKWWRQAYAGGFVWRVGCIAALASAWVLLEWLRSWIFTGFPWLPLAATQWERPMMLQIISYTGSWGLSWLLIFFNGCIAAYILHLMRGRVAGQPWWRKMCPELYLGLGVMAAGISLGMTGPAPVAPQQLGNVGFVQPYVAPTEKWDQAFTEEVLSDLTDISAYAKFLGADLILWPEAALPLSALGWNSVQYWFEKLSSTLERPILAGSIVNNGTDAQRPTVWYNAIVLVDSQNGINQQAVYAKRCLVPFGEYVPLAGWLPFLDKVVPLEGGFVPGTGQVLIPVSMPGGTIQVGSLICYEDIFPDLARKSVRDGADVLYVATNNAWYGEEAGAYQHAAHSVLRAVETRRPVLRSGNAGWSGWIDEFGSIRKVVMNEQGTIYFSGADYVSFSRNPAWTKRFSLYVRFGDWWVLLCGVIVLGYWIRLRMNNPKN